jgi:hypothetical protein
MTGVTGSGRADGKPLRDFLGSLEITMADEAYQSDRPASRPPAGEGWDDAPQPQRSVARGDAGISTLIPYRNKAALVGYYLGFLALLPAAGVVFGPLAVLLGGLGLARARHDPDAKGGVHAIVAIVLGLIGFFVMAPIGLGLLYFVFVV